MPAGPTGSIRAITSTLSARSAPSVPPSSQTYEPLVKATLRQRLLSNTLFPSCVSSWFLANAWSTWNQGGPSHLGLGGCLVNTVVPLTLVHTALLWLLGTIPAIVLRNRFATSIPRPASSPGKVFDAALKKRSTHYSLVVFSASAVALATSHMLMTSIYEPAGEQYRLSLFVKSKKHPYYLNGRVLYILTSQLLVATAYVLRTILLDKFVIHRTNLTSDARTARSTWVVRVISALITATIFAALCSTVHTFLFGLARSLLLPTLYALPVAPQLIKPFTAHFLRGPWSLTLLVRNWSLIGHTFLLGLTTVVCWELSESPLDQAVFVAQTTADPALTLVSGITSTDAYFKHCAYAELRQLAAEDSDAARIRRSTLFADQKFNPSMWACLCRDALLILGKDYQLLLRRGQPEAPAAAPAALPKPNLPLPATPTKLIRAPIMKPAPASPLRAALDTFASDGPLSTAMASTTDASISHIPELFRSVIHVTPSASKTIEAAKKGEDHVVGLFQQTTRKWRRSVDPVLQKYSPRPVLDVAREVAEWWRRDRIHRAVETSLPNRQLDTLVIDVLCHLVCASLSEDSYGVVQRDIPKIIEALLSFLTAIEDYHAEISKLNVPPTPEEQEKLSAKELMAKERVAMEVAMAGETMSEVGDALKDGIMQIARTFGDKLSAFKFSPRIAQKLQGFVDYA